MATVEQSKRLSDYWQEQISAWEQTDQTQKSFCEDHDLDYHRFGYWRRKYREQSPSGVIQQGSGFVPVRHSLDRVATSLILILPNGIRVQGIEESNLPLLSQLLRQL